MSNKIQIKRGLKAKLPTLSVGEPGLATDTSEVFVGGSSSNIQLAKITDITGNVINNLTSGGATKSLSAEQGKTLDTKVTALDTNTKGVQGIEIKSGTWEPSITINGVTATQAIRNGTYYKIGKLVFANCHVKISSKAGNAGSVTLYGLPFVTSGYVTGTASFIDGYIGNEKMLSFEASGQSVNIYVGNVKPVALQSTDISDSFEIYDFSITYITT